MNKTLLVNGYGMTALTPVTKMMAHFPLAFLDRPPQDALDICFGMGTTFRSLLSWNMKVTAGGIGPHVAPPFVFFLSFAPPPFVLPLCPRGCSTGPRHPLRPPPPKCLY